jgi:hypothetical protein
MNIEKFLINRNIARDRQQANYIMFAIIALCLLFIILKVSVGNSSTNNNSSQEDTELTADDQSLLGLEG